MHHVFLATTLWICTEQKETVGEPVMDGRLRKPRTMSRIMPHVPLLVESALNELTIGSGSTVSLVEQDSEVRVVSECHKLIRDVRNMIAGFL